MSLTALPLRLSVSLSVSLSANLCVPLCLSLRLSVSLSVCSPAATSLPLSFSRSHAVSPAAGAAPPGCNCTVEEAPVGLTADGTGKFVEDHTLAALKQLKERNPKITTIFYHDTGRMWTNDQ